jgi:hypothetical protein
MIANDNELKVTLERIAWFQEQAAHLRRVEANPQNYHAQFRFWQRSTAYSVEVREYLSIHPAEVTSTSTP